MYYDLIRAFLMADVPVLLWGAPGTGKTASLQALMRQLGAHMETLIGSTLDPIDVGGYLLPDAANSRVVSAPPPWARRIRAALDAGKPACLNLDELSCAPPAVQAALLRVVQERKVGELSLEGMMVIAAANPAETAADGGWLPAATANRWAHIEWQPDPQAWCAGTLGNWGAGYRTDAERRAASEMAGWIKHKPQALLKVPEGESQGKAWPSPRTWTLAMRAVAAAEGAKPDTLVRLVGSCVGDASAAEWVAWKSALDLPDPEEVLAGRASIPSRGDRASTCLGAVVLHALIDRRDRPARIDAAWKILAKQRPDVALTPAKTLLEGDPSGEIPDEAVALGKRVIRAEE